MTTLARKAAALVFHASVGIAACVGAIAASDSLTSRRLIALAVASAGGLIALRTGHLRAICLACWVMLLPYPRTYFLDSGGYGFQGPYLVASDGMLLVLWIFWWFDAAVRKTTTLEISSAWWPWWGPFFASCAAGAVGAIHADWAAFELLRLARVGAILLYLRFNLTPQNLTIVTLATLTSIALNSTIGVVQVVSRRFGADVLPGEEFVRAAGLVAHPNALAAYLLLQLPLLITLVTIRKGLSWLVIASAFVALGGTLSRTAWALTALEVLAMAIALIVLRLIRPQTVVRIGLIFLAVAMAAALPFSTQLARRVKGNLRESFDTRQELNRLALQIWWRRPVLGVGLNNFEEHLLQIAPEWNHDKQFAEMLSIRSVRLRILVHNFWLLLLAETGWCGLATFIWFLIGVYWPAFRLLGQRRAVDRAFGAAAAIGFSALLLQQFVEYTAWTDQILPTIALYAGTVAALPTTLAEYDAFIGVDRRMIGRSRLRQIVVVLFLGVVALVLLALLAPDPSPVLQPAANLVANPSFEVGAPVPTAWILDMAALKKANAAIDTSRVRTGAVCFRVSPDGPGARPAAVTQRLPVERCRGQNLVVSGWLGTEQSAVATLTVSADRQAEPSGQQVVLNASNTDGELRFVSGTLHVPDDVVSVTLTLSAAGTAGVAYFDDITVGPVEDPSERSESSPTAPIPAEVFIDATKVIRTIPRTVYGTNIEWIFDGNLLWDARRNEHHPQLVDLTRQLGVSLIRFPGGTLSDFYHWRDGVGPRADRKETEHLPGDTKSRHNFGTDEAIAFARSTNAELLLTVNVATGTSAEAADWVKYLTRADLTGPHVTYWEIGNEVNMPNGYPGSPTGGAMTAAEYCRRFEQFAIAMRKVDPSIRLLAIGGENDGRYSLLEDKNWNRQVVPALADHMDLLAVHNAYAPVVIEVEPREDLRTIYTAMLGTPLRIRGSLQRLSTDLRRLAPQRDIKLAITEWGPLFHPDPSSAVVDHGKTMASALFVGSTLKEFIESPSVEIANFFQLNDITFMGWIGPAAALRADTPAGEWNYRPKAPYLAMQLYTNHFATELLSSRVEVATFNSPGVGLVDPIQGVPYLDIVAAKSSDDGRLTFMAINKSFDRTVHARFTITGFIPHDRIQQWRLQGTGLDANTGTKLPLGIPWAPQIEDRQNPRFSKGGPEEVQIVEVPLTLGSPSLEIRFPPISMTCVELRAQENSTNR